MTPERWRQIEGLYHSACENGAGILANADPELRAEVERLLAQSSGSNILDRPIPTADATCTTATPGSHFGPYRIEGLLGEGGTGKVFLATDPRLGRMVAIKISQDRFTDRFEREARAIAALNHPNICTLHDVGPNYLVMELVEGESLASRLKRGKLTLEQTIQYGAQMAGALAAAHAKGIIHRDLKPANVMITKEGVKLLDFGAARSVEDQTVTRSGVVIGTPAYMAPEQRAGKECDSRTDVYSFGLVLAEMATGTRQSAEGLTGLFAHVVELCLVEDAEKRWQAARDIQHELEWIRTAETTGSAPQRPRGPWWVAVAAAVLLIATLGFFFARQPHPFESPASRLAINAPPGADFLDGLAISPDGRTIVFAARLSGQNKLWVRPLDSLAARELPGTDGGTFPFWSPDSRSIAFFAGGKLRRIDVATGVSAVICDVGAGRGGTWNEEGTILFNSVNDGPLLRVAASGGTPAPVTRVDQSRSENSHRFPFFLPHGRKFLFYVRADDANSGVYLASLDHPLDKVRIFRSPTAAIFVPVNGGSGDLMWVDNGTLLVRPFDPERGQFQGEASALAERVRHNYPGGRYAEISAAQNGTIVYGLSGDALNYLTWYGRDGKASGAIGAPDAYSGLRLSPNGARVAVVRAASASHEEGIALIDLARGVAMPLISAFWGAWSPDGESIAFTSGVGAGGAGGAPKVQVLAIGDRKGEQLTNSSGSQMVLDWSHDGRFILYWEHSNDLATVGRPMLWVLPLVDRKPVPFAPTSTQNPTAQFSPNSRWIAYSSQESGRIEVYVQGFPTGSKWQVSDRGGSYPRWTKDGNELAYLALDRTLMSVPVRRTGNALDFGAPSPLFKLPLPVAFTGSRGDDSSYPFDTTADGQRILALAPAGEREPPTLVVVANWRNRTTAAR